MRTRTWPYGTVKNVTVHRVEGSGKTRVVAVIEDEPSKEGFLLMGQDFEAKKGDRGTITFTQGGPTGGYWHYTSVEMKPDGTV